MHPVTTNRCRAIIVAGATFSTLVTGFTILAVNRAIATKAGPSRDTGAQVIANHAIFFTVKTGFGRAVAIIACLVGLNDIIATEPRNQSAIGSTIITIKGIAIVTDLTEFFLHASITTRTMQYVTSRRAVVPIVGIAIITDFIRLLFTVTAAAAHGTTVSRTIITIGGIGIIARLHPLEHKTITTNRDLATPPITVRALIPIALVSVVARFNTGPNNTVTTTSNLAVIKTRVGIVFIGVITGFHARLHDAIATTPGHPPTIKEAIIPGESVAIVADLQLRTQNPITARSSFTFGVACLVAGSTRVGITIIAYLINLQETVSA